MAFMAQRFNMLFIIHRSLDWHNIRTLFASLGLLRSVYLSIHRLGNIGILFYRIYYLAFDYSFYFWHKKDALSDASRFYFMLP